MKTLNCNTTSAKVQCMRRQPKSRVLRAVAQLMVLFSIFAVLPVPQVMAQDPKQEAMVSWGLAYEQYRQKNYIEAIDLYKKALPYFKDNYKDNIKFFQGIIEQLSRSYMSVAETQEALFDSAITVINLGLELEPENVKWNDVLRWLYERTGKEEETLQQLERLYEITADVNWIQQLKGKYLAKKEYSKAIETYDILLAKDPNNTDLLQEKLNLIRRLAADSEDKGAVREQLLALHEKDPSNKDYVNELLMIAKNNQDEAEILKWADKILELNPQSAFAYECKIEICQFRDDKKQVLAILEEQAKNIPDDPSVHIHIGEINLDLNNFPAAVSAANRALKIREGYGAAYLLIGDAYDQSAQNCIQKKGGSIKMNFDDKLVYKKAYDWYARAASDPEYKARAERKMQSLTPVLPEPGDYFMNKDKKEPEGPCYSWF